MSALAAVATVLFAIQPAQAPPASGAAIPQQRAAVEKSERIMAEAQRRPGLLAQYLYMRDAYTGTTAVPFRLIFNQYLSWFQTWVGDYAGARTTFTIAQPAQKGDSPSPLEHGYRAEPAVEAIAALAQGRQAVFFNENHSNALTRTLTVQMLTRLRAQGFDHFAAETLYSTDKKLAARGYPIAATGFYTEEPIYAEMVRTALDLGYVVVAYEAESDAIGDAREREQARNLIRRTLDAHPQARIVVNAGYAHIQEAGRYFDGKSMAQHFAQMSRIDPLTIEQTFMTPHASSTDDHPLYTAVTGRLQPQQPTVFRDAGGAPWSLRADAYDVSVIFPADTLRRGRPTWLALGGERLPYPITSALCAGQYPCLLEARYADEPDEAIPADRVVFDPAHAARTTRDRVRTSADAEPTTDLYLRPDRYRLTARSTDNRVLGRRTIDVSAATATQGH